MGHAYTDGDTLKSPMSAPTSPHEPPSGQPAADPAPSPDAGGQAVLSHGWLSANSSFTHVDERKIGRAMSTSVVLHGAAVGIVLLVMALRPPVTEPEVAPPEKYDLVFLQTKGPGGGGGGGGNQMQTPPAKLEMKAVAPKPAVIEPPKLDVPPPPPPPALTAPVQMTVVVPMAGTVSGLSAAPSLGTGSGGGGGTGTGTGTGPGRGSGIGDGTGGGFGGGAMRPGNGVTNPTILRQMDPRYTPEAMRAKVQGIVELEAVVGTNGVITEIRILKSLDRAFGLDEEAIKTAKQWLFRPGRFQGQNVPVVVVIQMEFRLH